MIEVGEFRIFIRDISENKKDIFFVLQEIKKDYYSFFKIICSNGLNETLSGEYLESNSVVWNGNSKNDSPNGSKT